MIIEKIIPGGQGLATLPDGRKIFLWGVLTGEEVLEYEVTRKKSHWCEGVATKIAHGSEHRVEAKDECYLSTSPWQIFDYDFELECKREVLAEQFRQAGILLDAPEVATDGKDFYYRNKMEYALYYDNELQRILPAFHARGSHRKVPIAQSSIERPEIFAEACRVIDDLNRRGEEARKYQSLLIRCNARGEVAGGLYENRKPHPRFPLLSDELLGREYLYSPNGFFQINLPVYEMALREISKWVEGEKVLDLYAGVGTIGLSVAGERALVSVESDGAAYAELAKNSDRTHKLARSEEALDYIEPEMTVIVDPPRAGCAQKLTERFLAVCPQRIIYLSCNPATQARDVKILLEKYKIVAVQPFNFFPRTPHLENLVVLDLKK